jgi:hypothetical protein
MASDSASTMATTDGGSSSSSFDLAGFADALPPLGFPSHPNSLALKGEGELERKRALVASFLMSDEKIPVLGLGKFLEKPGSLDLFASFVTRDDTPLKVDTDFEDARYSQPHVFAAERVFGAGEEDEDALKRAHRAATLLGAGHEPIDYAVSLHPNEVVASAIRAFRHASSKASVYHLCLVLSSVVKLNPEAVIAYLSEGPRIRLCLGALLENCHVPQVVDVVFRILSVRKVNEIGMQVRPETLKLFHKRLLAWGPLAVLVGRITSAVSDEPRAFGWADLVARIAADFDAIPESMELDPQADPAVLKPLSTPSVVESIVRAACQVGLDSKSEAALHLLSVLTTVVVGKPLAVQAPPLGPDQPPGALEKFAPQTKKPHRLAKLAGEFRMGIAPHALVLCNALDEALVPVQGLRRHSSYEIDSPFSFRRLTLVRALVAVSTTPDLLVKIPWASFCRWQIKYPNNSLYQHEFVTLFERAIKCDYDACALRTCLVELKFLSHLTTRLQEYSDATDHGHVLKCLNMLRLRCDQLPDTHWLVEFLSEDEQWQECSDTLSAATRRLLMPLKDETPVRGGGARGPASALHSIFASDPDNPLSGGLLEDYKALAEQEALDMMDIGLGSAYAKALGFDNAALADPNGGDVGDGAGHADKPRKKKAKAKGKGKKR